jgi:hypothetical protein
LANDLVWHGMPIASIVRWSAIMPIGDQATEAINDIDGRNDRGDHAISRQVAAGRNPE